MVRKFEGGRNLRKLCDGISVAILENHEFPFGFVCNGEILMDYKKIGNFAYSFNDRDYCLRVKPRFQAEFEKRIQQFIAREKLHKNDVGLFLYHLVECQIPASSN